MMKNSGFVPEEVKLNKELVSLRELINSCEDRAEKESYKKKLTEKELQYRLLLDKQKLSKSSAYKRYSAKISKRFGL